MSTVVPESRLVNITADSPGQTTEFINTGSKGTVVICRVSLTVVVHPSMLDNCISTITTWSNVMSTTTFCPLALRVVLFAKTVQLKEL